MCHSYVKPRPNDSNISTQHIPTLLAEHFQTIATTERNGSQHCWAQHVARVLATLLQRVATCCELNIELVRMPGCNTVGHTWPNDHNIMPHPQMLRQKFDHF